jgi:hypothetical protein
MNRKGQEYPVKKSANLPPSSSVRTLLGAAAARPQKTATAIETLILKIQEGVKTSRVM